MNIHQPEDLGVLRFITAGSVDDGKSLLIGGLLYDSKAVLSDQLSALSRAKNKRTVGDEIDLSLLTDGLEAPARPSEVDRPVRETNVPTPERTMSPREPVRNP